MKPLNLTSYFPCIALFRASRPIAGVLAVVMQATLVFWPVAARWAHETKERTAIERLLNELSEINKCPEDPYRHTPKKFRQLA